MNSNIIPFHAAVTRNERSLIKGHRPAVLWFTGLSASGKSTIASKTEHRLNADYQAHTYLLDGDAVRHGLNKDLGFSEKDRTENIRRVAEVSRILYDAGLIVLTAFISPYRADRDAARTLFSAGSFVEIFVNCPLEICSQRDPKQLYQKARAGLIPEFTGISSPYEIPSNPELVLDSNADTIETCSDKVIRFLINHHIIIGTPNGTS
jgi:adenylylsulfate kinase